MSKVCTCAVHVTPLLSATQNMRFALQICMYSTHALHRQGIVTLC